jgi:3-oxoacyl-(acyl-carrier-protein) synthase
MMARERLFIRGLSTISAMGQDRDDCATRISENTPSPSDLTCSTGVRPVFRVPEQIEQSIAAFGEGSEPHERDRVTRFAGYVASRCLDSVPEEIERIDGISFGSSRGTTESLERTTAAFVAKEGKEVPLYTSPSTTFGVISAHVGRLLLNRRMSLPGAVLPVFAGATSMTCSSAFHALVTGVAFIRAGMARAWLFGGSEACLTAYTALQLEALRMYSKVSGACPCRPCAIREGRENYVVLGEGAGAAILTTEPGPDGVELLGAGWALEAPPSATGITSDGQAFGQAMQGALEGLPKNRRVDAVIMHAPGTSKGDEAEVTAIQRLFGNEPLLCTTKHLSGHTYGASGMISLELARYLLAGGEWGGVSYESRLSAASNERQNIRTVLINTAGFGGNAVSIVVGRS